jgi:large subunit ribosomal protein L25
MHILEGKIRRNKIDSKEKLKNIPAIFYGKDIKENLSLTIDYKEFTKFFDTVKRGCFTTVLKLKIENQEYHVIIKDIQWNKLTSKPQHIDFYSISGMEELTDKNNIKVKYYIHYLNSDSCSGVKEGGKLKILHKECYGTVNPHKMSSNLEIDLKNLKIGNKVTVDNIQEQYKYMNLRLFTKGTLVTILGK